METAEMMDRLQDIMRDILDIDDLIIALEYKISDSEGWDSLSKINLFSSVEKEFSIKFTVSDLEKFTSVADIVQKISRES